MSRETSDCSTFVSSEEDMPEPETEDFLNEVVANSMRKRKKKVI